MSFLKQSILPFVQKIPVRSLKMSRGEDHWLEHKWTGPLKANWRQVLGQKVELNICDEQCRISIGYLGTRGVKKVLFCGGILWLFFSFWFHHITKKLEFKRWASLSKSCWYFPCSFLVSLSGSSHKTIKGHQLLGPYVNTGLFCDSILSNVYIHLLK